jgi:hypothetical protein
MFYNGFTNSDWQLIQPLKKLAHSLKAKVSSIEFTEGMSDHENEEVLTVFMDILSARAVHKQTDYCDAKVNNAEKDFDNFIEKQDVDVLAMPQLKYDFFKNAFKERANFKPAHKYLSVLILPVGQ